MANKFGGMGAAMSNAAQTIKNPSSQLNGPVDNSTDAIYKSARQFYNSGNSEAGNNVLRDYYAQTVNKNSQYYQAQYSYWDEANGDEQKTLAAESDLLNMYNAVNDAVGKGYSDSWIKNNISAKNYPGLASLTNDTVLTRQLQYWGDETVNGMIYAARNPEDEVNGQDIRSAAGMYGLRWGNSYRPNYKSEAAKDPKSDIYHPYMQGNHTDDEEAKNTAISAKEQLARLQKACLARLDKGQTPDEIYDLYFGNNMHGLDWGVDDEPAYFTLHQMEDARQHQTAVPLSEDVDFAAPYFKQWLYDQAEDKQAQKGELDALAQSQYLTRQYTSLTENVPEAYQEAVWALYAQDKGITEVTAEAYTGLDAWLKENGLIGKQDNFREAYNDAAAKLTKKWDSEVRPNEKFSPATFIVDGENADPETNDKQVSFRRGMQNYLAGRPTNNADAKAFAQKYGFLFDNYQYKASTAADAVEANIVQMSLENRPARADSLGSELDEALDRLDAARFDGKITDEEYFNHYLEIATAYDNYKTLAAQKGETADPKGFADYLGKGADVYGNTFSDKFVESIGQTITAGEAAYEERRKAEVAAVSQRFGQFERDANSGKAVDNDEFKQIRGIEINPSEFQDDLSNKFDMAYTGAYNYAMTAHLDPTREYGAHYDESYARLASYDVAEVVNDIMRLAQYTGTDFTSACNAMGFDTEDDLYAYLDNYAYSVNKKCSDTVEALYTVGGQLLQSAAGTTADDLVLNEKIDLDTYTLFMNGMGNADNEQKFYNRVGDLGGIPAAALVYKDALEESHPNENEAHGYSSNIFDIALNGSWNGLLTHANSWVMAALGFQSLTDAERENRARLDFNNDPAAYRAEIQSAIETIDDPKVRQEAFDELASYNGDIFKFDFDTNRFTIALQDANRDLNERRNALDSEMKEFFSPAAYKAYTGLGSAVNSGFISLESVMVGKALMAFGMTKGPAMFLGQLVTTGPIEGGETAYKLKQAGVNSPLANLTGLANGAAIAAIEWGSDAFVNKFAYKNKFIKRIEDYGKINVASKVLQVQDALDAAGIKGGAAWLLRNGARFGLGAINTGFGMLKSTGSEIVQELGEYTLTGGLEYGAASLAGVNADQFAPTLEGAGEIAVATGISTQFQKILPWNFGKTILDTVRNTNTQNSFVNDTRNTTLDLKARTESEIGAAGNEMAAMQAEIDAATAERQAAMDKLKGMNIEARVDQETLKNLEEPALALQNSDLSRKINDLTERDARLQNDLADLNAQHEEATARVEEVQAAIDAGDVSKETLDWLNDCTAILRTLDRRTSETQANIDSNTEELTKLKAEKQAQRQQAYDAARQQAIDTVMDEVTTDEAERLMDSIDRSDKLIAETKAKHEAAKNRVQTLLENYQAELRRLEAETRSTAGEINSMSEDGDILSDGLVDLALGISNEMSNIDVAEATAKEASIKASLVKQLEMSFNGYKVEMRPMGRGNHGRVAIDGGNGIIILNSDSTSYELMNGELGYELGRMAQISSPADYKALYDAATKAVYGSKEGTEKAYSKVFARLVSEGVTTDTTQPNNAVVRAGSEVFADAIGRLFSGEFRNNKWVQDFSENAPELAGDIFDWIAMRAKEFKAMAKHGDKQFKAQYNAIVDVLSKLADSLHKSDTVDFNGETVPVDVTPVVAEETRTDDASDFVNSLVHRRLNETRKRYVGEKRLPLFEKQDDGSYTIDRNGLTTEENDLISEVERAELQAEYNALNGEVTAETLKSEAAEAIGKPLRREATAEERAANTEAKAERLATREERLEQPEPVTVAEEPTNVRTADVIREDINGLKEQNRALGNRLSAVSREKNRLKKANNSDDATRIEQLEDETAQIKQQMEDNRNALVKLGDELFDVEHPTEPFAESATTTVAEEAPAQVETVAEQPVPEQAEKDIPAKPDDKKAAKLADLQNKLDRLMKLDDVDYQFIVENSQTTTTNITGEETVMIGEANEGQEAAVAKARKRRERRAAQIAKIQTQQQELQAELNNDYSVQEGSNVNPFMQSQTTEQDNAEQQTEQPAQTEEPVVEQAQPTAGDELAGAVADMIDNAAQLDEDARNKAFGAIRGLIHSIKNGNRSNADATSTPLAIVKNLFDSFGGTLYQNILNVKDKAPVQVNSRPGYIASKRLLVRDMNAYIDAAGEHVMNVVQHEVDTNGVTTDLTSNTPEANIAMFNAWLTAGIDGLRGMSRFAVDTLNDFGDKLHLALINSKDGRTMWAALNEAKDKLAAYYNADAIRRAQAYVRSTPESQQSGQFSTFLKRKAEFLGQDLYGDVFDSMTGYGTSFRKALRYLPYAKSLGNMWVGDHDTAKGFIDLNRKIVPGAQTMSEAVRSPFNARYFAKHKDGIWKNVNLMLALQSALDRYTPLEQVEMKNGKPVLDENGNPKTKKVNRDPFSGLTDKGLTEAAKFLGINGHPTKESIQTAINELSRDHRLVEAADNVREWWRNIMRIAVKEGMVTQETYDKFQQENPHYAPLQRDMSTIVKKGRHTDSNPTTTQGELDITSSGISFRRAKGHSDRAIIDPLLSFAEMAQQMADKLVANRTAKEFVRIYDAAPYDSIGMFAGEVSNGQGDALARKGTDILNVYYEDGTHRSFVVNNPELLQLLQGKELNADRSGWAKGLAHVTRFMSRLTTTDNPIFAIRNAIRDYQTSVNYGSWAGSYIDGIGKWLSALGECLRYTYSKSWNELFHNDNEGNANGQLRDFLFYGGEGFMRKSMTHNNKENIYGEVMGESWGRRALSSTWDLLTFGTLNDAVEMASRYVEYKYGKNNETNDAKGATDQSKFNSFMDSREVTVDFAQAGYGTLAKTLRQVVPFFNATLQGWYRTGRMFTQAERGRLAARATKTILNNTIAGALSAVMCCFGKSTLGAFLGDDDAWEEQVKEYLKLSKSMKTDYIILPLTGLGFIGAKDFIRVPLLQDGLGKFCFNMGRLEVERVARRMRGEDVTIGGLGKDLLRVAWDVFKEPFDRDITLKPFIDMALNRTFYGTPLVNENKLDEDPSTWGNATTPQLAYDISNAERAALKWLFGENLPQWLNLIFSPAGVEYTFKEYFGYIGQIALPMASRDRYTGKARGFEGLTSSVISNFTLDAESTNDISTNWKKAQDNITRISKLTEDGIGISPLSSYLTTEERYAAVMEAKQALAKGGVVYEARQKSKELWAEFYRIMGDQSIPEKEKEQATEIIRKQINDNEAEATAWEEAFEAKYSPNLNVIASIIDDVRAGRQTLKDSGEGVTKAEEPTASTNPADLPVARAGMPNLGDLTQTLPYIGEESENVQAPLTSPDYTGERVRGVTTDYMGQQTETPAAEQAPEFSIAGIAPTPTTPTTSRSAAEVGEDVAEGAESITNRGWNSHRRRQPQPITPANAAIAMREYQRGNVDLYNRPQIDASKLTAAGWEDAEDGTATVFSVMYTAGNTGDYDYNWGNNTILHMTPIKADGTVLSQAELERYADSLLRNTTVDSLMEADKPENGGLGLMLWAQPVTGTLNNALKTGEQYDVGLHEAQEQYYLGNGNTLTAQTTTPVQSNSTGKYNVASNVQDVSGIYAKKSRNGLDNWSRRNVRTLYGDALPESFYSEMETYMNADKTSTKYVPIPNDSYAVDSVTYNVKDYPGADVDVVNWYGDAYIEAYNNLMNDPVYQNGTAEERMSMFKELDTKANTAAKRQFVLKYVSAKTKGIANNLDERTMDVAMHLSKEYSARTNEATIRDIYGDNLPASWYSEFKTAWDTEKDTALLPFPSASIKVDSTTYYLTDYNGAQKDVMNWYADKYLAEYEKLTKTSAYINGSQADRASKLASLDKKANDFAMTNFKVKYLGITG